ncbi:MAG: response regulator transcription factor [Bacteroidales bacterium]|nr:response regulator transcription factor [Bacteroidales bacterium]
MKQKKILIVDDEQDLCDILLFNLHAADYQADYALSAEEALTKDLSSYHLFLLDVMMTGMSGFDLAKALKAQPSVAQTPIIFLTAKDTEADLLRGFEIGADDYIAKPFSVKEVMARVKAVLNRLAPHESTGQDILTYEGLVINHTNKTVMVDGESATLTKTEFELLYLFLQNRGKVFTRQQVIDRVWPKEVIVTDRTVDVNITRMRKKIGRYSMYLIARQGYGYIFEE